MPTRSRTATAAAIESATSVHNAGVDDIEVGPEGIRLGQLLKLANLAETGGEAKAMLADGMVSVNGAVETRRGAQLQPGDVVSCAGAELRLT